VTQGDFGPVAARLRSAAGALSPGAAPLARWLRTQAAALEASTATLAKALSDYRELPVSGDDRYREARRIVRSYRVAQATDAVLGIADEFEFLARALLADGDVSTARAFCATADQIDEALEKAYKDHPGWDLLPSKLDPRVKRWQRVTTVNAADTPGDANPRVDPEQDWAERHRTTLRALQEMLDEQLERNTGKRPRVRHRRGVGGYQGSTEATSLSQYPDPDGKVFAKGLAAAAAVGLAFRQKEVFLSREFPADEKVEARALAARVGGIAVATMAVGIKGDPVEVLARIREFAGDHEIPGLTLLRGERGIIDVRFFLDDPKESKDPRKSANRAVGALLAHLADHLNIREVSYGWAASRCTGDGDELNLAMVNHSDNLRRQGYSYHQVQQLDVRGDA